MPISVGQHTFPHNLLLSNVSHCILVHQSPRHYLPILLILLPMTFHWFLAHEENRLCQIFYTANGVPLAFGSLDHQLKQTTTPNSTIHAMLSVSDSPGHLSLSIYLTNLLTQGMPFRFEP